ncbi:DNA-binding transcriptional activator of the SARP family [Lentzea xinjiangensis]|uniref:DNA-binding transcriptional activator of the SARP family n=1 Tax=Lentzea xinjiangensis TaxID=402600 RepID=A0A1H9RS14_9PSEU|nr:BTAD domain-containing putative transcriptional regulator [Lentzea xinjiangensis]SER75741.1 DNA-binding transcriptional activator of the SARP family [Lentzea xinjiangensis]
MNEASEGGRRTGTGGERLVLLGRFELFTGSGDVVLPKGAQRLLAFLAIHHGDAVSRQAAAEQLWPGCRRQRANANVRQALWHLRRATDRPVVEPSVDRLRLSPALTVDFCRAVEAAHLVVGPSAPLGPRVADGLVDALSQDLLPYWAEEWLAPERRRWEQVRLHALEAIAQRFISAGAHLAALEAAFTAIAIDPVRETAHRTVVAAHLAQGNCGSALRHYQQYRALLHRELGVAPSAQMTRLVASQAAM